jgi:hypothetical protein
VIQVSEEEEAREDKEELREEERERERESRKTGIGTEEAEDTWSVECWMMMMIMGLKKKRKQIDRGR